MSNRLDDILGKYVDTNMVRAEAEAMYGDRASGEILLAIAMKHFAEKFNLQLEELKNQLFVKAPSLQELEDQGKIWTGKK